MKTKLIILITFIFVSTTIFGQINSNVDVLNYKINLNITDFDNKTITGNCELTLLLNDQNKDTIVLGLLSLDVTKILINNKETKRYSYDKKNISINLKKQNLTGDTLYISVFYQGKPTQDPSWGGFFFKNEIAYNIGIGMTSVPHGFGRVWFPCNDSFEDRATYQFNITTKNEHKAICSGILVNTFENADGTNMYKWQQTKEVPTYMVSVAVGNFEEIAYNFNGLERTIPVQMFVKPSLKAKMLQSFQNLNSAIEIFETKYYPYPWARVGFVGVPFESGAMEHVCNIAYPEYAIDGTLNKETLFVHEFSHHWFGDFVTCKTPADMWLNEGWASFSEAIFLENKYGNKKYKEYSRKRHRFVLEKAHLYDQGYFAIAPIPEKLTYGSTVYKKGADAAQTLRGYLGDSLFFGFIHKYMKEKQLTNVSTLEFEKFISENTKTDMTDFFETWIYTPGFVHFSVLNFKTNKKSYKFETEVEILQKLSHKEKFGKKNKIELTFIGKNLEKKTLTKEFSGEISSQKFILPFMPVAVFTDLEEKIMDATVDNYTEFSAPGVYNFPETDFKLVAKKVKHQTFMQATLNIIPPTKHELKNYTLSKTRYWTINGVTFPNFSAQGIFLYDYKANKLNKDKSKIVLLFRTNENEKWKKIKTTQSERNKNQYICTDLKFGQYTFAEKLNP